MSILHMESFARFRNDLTTSMSLADYKKYVTGALRNGGYSANFFSTAFPLYLPIFSVPSMFSQMR